MGLIYHHGPVGDKSSGSGKLPKQLNAVLPSPVSLSLSQYSHEDLKPLPCACPTTSSASVVSCESIPAVQVLERIPKAARHQCCLKLATILEVVVKGTSVDAWNWFFCFSTSCLREPARLRGRTFH